MAKGMWYGLLEGVSCDSQTAQTSILAALILGKEILLHNDPADLLNYLWLFLQDENILTMTWLKSYVMRSAIRARG